MAKPEAEKKRAQTLDDVVNADFTAARKEYHFRTPVLVDKMVPMLKDERDVPMLCLLLNIVQVVVPGAIFVYGVNLLKPPMDLLTCNLCGLGYMVAILILFQERFTLCIHFASHRSIFHNEALNLLIGWVVAPFFGIPCGIYKLHHVVMHHIENNHSLDTSSTEMFQRDSWADFGKYWFRFVVLIWIELPYYCFRTKRWNWFAAAMGGLLSWLAVVVTLMRYVSPLATTWVFIVPHIVAMSAMAFGNWSQHIFVNPKDRFSNYGLTYNCIDTPVNQTTFNDGYHIVHHLNARLHWSEIPQYFYDTREKHHQGGALTFRGVHFMDVGFYVMTKQLHKLAECYVHLGSKETAPTTDEVVEKLKSLLVPCADAPAPTEAKKTK
mmetsp:Transcript_124612/g.360459  ORF Transcript_124612/g.360459 Transcript_124612/m.360459 type:complete len:380 (-) Transcript_124612:66-1205(-)